MNEAQDTEITLGMGRILGIFFTLVALCGIFFGLGFKLGKSETTVAASEQMAVTQTNGGPRPSAAPQSSAPASRPLTAAEQTAAAAANTSDATAQKPVAADAAALSGASYFVQVAAVSKQEDADALVDSLKKKQYAALAASASSDKLFHVQVGPFSDIKDAEAMRTRLMNDGYNPILKK
ncbi:MAG TPA: SPOR domain-containing protein [Terriglobales bacterium]|nr:SPOR domain-containing protein [Terriglobales bacterium]